MTGIRLSGWDGVLPILAASRLRSHSSAVIRENAWHQLGRGKKVQEKHLTIPVLAAMLSGLSPNRLELPRAIHETSAPSVKALAELPGSDYKCVHEDVETLTASGLLSRDNRSVASPDVAITSEMRL